MNVTLFDIANKNEILNKSSPQFNSFNLIEYYLEERKHEYTTPTTVIPKLWLT